MRRVGLLVVQSSVRIGARNVNNSLRAGSCIRAVNCFGRYACKLYSILAGGTRFVICLPVDSNA